MCVFKRAFVHACPKRVYPRAGAYGYESEIWVGVWKSCLCV